MCKFCETYIKSDGWEQNKYLIEETLKINKTPFMGIQVYLSEGNKLVLYIDQGDSCDPYSIKTKSIKYCPMCGKKLERYEN